MLHGEWGEELGAGRVTIDRGTGHAQQITSTPNAMLSNAMDTGCSSVKTRAVTQACWRG